jgi:hypothetical protein
MSIARFGHTATPLIDGLRLLIVVTGGEAPSRQPRPLASVELYDPASNSWAPAGSLATARFNDTATIPPRLDGGLDPSGVLTNVLVVGGSDSQTYNSQASAERTAP